MASDFIDNEPCVEVWDESWDALMLFSKYSTQWRMAMNGPVALDLSVFLHELDRKKVPEKDYDDFLDKLSVIEAEALVQLRKS